VETISMTARTELATGTARARAPLAEQIPVPRPAAAAAPPTTAAPRPVAPSRVPPSGVRARARRARTTLATGLDRVEVLLDPVVRPVVTALQRRRGGPTADELLERYRAGEYREAGRWGRQRWKAPAKRAVVPLDPPRMARSVARLLRSGRFEVTFDTAFADVVSYCATVRGRATSGRAWLCPAMQEAYRELHERGHAHSVEVWRDGRLVGGEFGVAVAGLYSGDSSFFLESGASKVALARLNQHLHERGFLVHDTQVVSALSGQFGAHYVSREEYRRRLRTALVADVTF
jgi:leucyl/phenylalanyl-tRNA---protein transferase